MIRQLAHLNFITNDLNRIIDFYVNKLALRVENTSEVDNFYERLTGLGAEMIERP
jgi:catechol 2,3-dioxygenase-like lactoylglutathione lyase family enzyme